MNSIENNNRLPLNDQIHLPTLSSLKPDELFSHPTTTQHRITTWSVCVCAVCVDVYFHQNVINGLASMQVKENLIK